MKWAYEAKNDTTSFFSLESDRFYVSWKTFSFKDKYKYDCLIV